MLSLRNQVLRQEGVNNVPYEGGRGYDILTSSAPTLQMEAKGRY